MNLTTLTSSPLTVVGISVRQDEHGRYSLNDLHKAAMTAGRATESQRPGEFLRTAGAKAFVAALDLVQAETENLTAGIPAVKTQEGRYGGGTFGARLVVLRYAAWIDPTFEVQVYQTFDAALTEAVTKRDQQILALQAAQGLLAGARGSICITDAAKALGLNPQTLFTHLNLAGWIYKRPGGKVWRGRQDVLSLGLITYKTEALQHVGESWMSSQVRITSRGLNRLAETFAI